MKTYPAASLASVLALALVFGLAACDSRSATAVRSLPSIASGSAANVQFLYVASTNGVSVYLLGTTVPIRTLRAKNLTAMAFDRSGYLYIAHRYGRPKNRGYVSVFAPGSITSTRTIFKGMSEPYSLAFDASGNLYVANYLHLPGAPKFNNGSITVYKPNFDKPYRTITKGLDHPRQIIITENGDLVAAIRQRVRFYDSGTFAPQRTVTARNSAIGLGAQNRTFVGNSQGCPNYCFANVDVYVPWKKHPVASYRLNDLDYNGFLPTAYAFDSMGYVYMSLSGGKAYLPGRVVVFPPLPKDPAYPLYDLHGPEMTGPLALLIDPSDNLIVGNNGAVDAYAAHSQTLSYQITQGISGQVIALAIASQ